MAGTRTGRDIRTFLSATLRRPGQVGAFAPSSTRLARLPVDGRLVAVELDADLVPDPLQSPPRREVKDALPANDRGVITHE
jgi:hypothetical protein